MAEVAGPVPAPLHSGIPDDIVVWEILVRLPPEDLLRCRAVCPAWRRATSTRDFLLAHHSRQPSLPIVYHYEFGCNFCENLIALDHRSGADAQLQHVARFDEREIVGLEASCDGLLVHADSDDYFSICNPATHQYAPLPQLYGFNLFGMYLHSPTGEYRLLLRAQRDTAYYVFILGSGQPPRHIEYPEAEEATHNPLSVLLHGNLHWLVDAEQHVEEGTSMIMVFDTTAELFRQMPAPPVSGSAQLFEMGDMLAMACSVMTDRESANKSYDVFVMKDYECQVWAFKCRIELQVEEISTHCENQHSLAGALVMPGDGELLVLVDTQDCVHHLDINGKLVASFYCGGLTLSKFRLKQTLVPHTLFSSIESYVVNDSPFIWRSNFSFLKERYEQEEALLGQSG